MNKNHNATPVANGWNFQSNAAIVLFLRNIKNARKVKVEGIKEDIEITLNNGNKIMAQVKSTYIDDDSTQTDESNNPSKFKKAVESLNDSNDDLVEKLVYIINSRNPFNETQSPFNLTGIVESKYIDLPMQNQQRINELISSAIEANPLLNNFDVNKLTIMTIPFEGSDEMKYSEIRHEVSNFLTKLNVSERYDRDYSGKLQLLFWDNASKKNIELKKEQVIWPLIVLISNNQDIENVELFEKFDEGEVQDIINKYDTVMEREINDFQFVSIISYDYDQFKITNNGHNRTAINDFITNNWHKYKTQLSDIIVDETILEGVIKLVLYNILIRKNTIIRIKNEVNII